jgi:dipeptidyl aminopeptidase/acylaminoacyl peptidase
MVRTAFRTMTCALALMSFTPATAADRGVPVTPDILLSHISRNAEETPVHPRMQWLDNGRRILISTVTSQAQAGAGRGQFAEYVPLSYLQRTVDVRTGAITDIGVGYDPVVAAQADVIAYQPEGSGGGRLVVARSGGAATCEISVAELMPDTTGVEAVALAADGGHIAVAVGYGAPRFAAPKAAPASGAAVRVLEAAAPEEWGHNVAVWVLDGRCGDARRIADLSETRIGRLTWADQDRKIVAATATPVPGKGFPRSDLHLFDPATGQGSVLASNIGGQGAAFLQAAPVGPYVAFTYDKEGLGYQLRKQFAIASIADGRIHVVSTDPRERPRWLDERTVLADISGAHPLTRRLATVDIEGRETELSGIPANAMPSPDGRRLAWLDIDLYGGASLSVADMRRTSGSWTASPRRQIWKADPPLASYARAERRFVRCESTDGVHPEAILVLPLDHDPRRRYPLIVDLHGGPRGGLDGGSHGAYTPGTILSSSSLEHDMWAAKGYAVLVADYRASGLYGFDAVSRTGEAYAQDFDDIMCNVDAVIRDGVADPDRMAVIGHSYGAYEVNWIITHTHRFKAAISKEGGFADHMAGWGAGARTNQLATTLYGTPIDNPDVYRRMSPINFTRGVTTPTMFVSHRGGALPGDLYGWMYAAWREQGIDAQYRIYDDPNHVLIGEADQRDQLYAAIGWIDRYLMPERAGGLDETP